MTGIAWIIGILGSVVVVMLVRIAVRLGGGRLLFILALFFIGGYIYGNISIGSLFGVPGVVIFNSSGIIFGIICIICIRKIKIERERRIRQERRLRHEEDIMHAIQLAKQERKKFVEDMYTEEASEKNAGLCENEP